MKYRKCLGAILVGALALGLDAAAAQNRLPKPAVRGLTVPAPATTVFPAGGAAIDVQYGPNAEASARPGGLPQFDVISSVATVGPGTHGVGQVSAIAGTVRGLVPAVQGASNNALPVAGFFQATCEINNCNSWALNTRASDSNNNTATPGAAGRVIQTEFDYDVFNDSTVVKGINVVMNGFQSTRTSTYAFIADINTLSPAWSEGFKTNAGAAYDAFVAGPLKRGGTTVASQPLAFQYYNTASAIDYVRVAAVPSATDIRLVQTGGTGFQSPGFYLPNGGQLQAANSGGGVPITLIASGGNNEAVLGLNANQVKLYTDIVPPQANTRNVGTPATPFGAVAAAQFYAGNAQGVSCSGPPTSNFQVTAGIVTRC